MQILKYFTVQYLFQSGFINLARSDWAYIYLAGALTLGGLALLIFSLGVKDRLLKYIISKWIALLLTIGILALLWSLFRYQAVATLSARIIIILIYLIGLAWTVSIIRFWRGPYRHQKKAFRNEQLKRKYI